MFYCFKQFSLQKIDPEVVFTKQERIGKGSFGEVYKGLDNRSQKVLDQTKCLQQQDL